MKYLLLFISFSFLAACSSQPILPEADSVKVSRKKAADDCKSLGKIEGRSRSRKTTKEAVLKDLKQEAANKGANYVVIKQWSSLGGSVTGIAYQCD